MFLYLVFQEVQSLLLNWKGPDLTTYGELVLEGNFKVHRAKNERTLFLFDRVLLITKRRGEHYVYKTHISVSGSRQTSKSCRVSGLWFKCKCDSYFCLRVSVLHTDAQRKRQRLPELQRHALQKPQTASHRPGESTSTRQPTDLSLRGSEFITCSRLLMFQAKTVEEKKLWAHHIKRIIVENHQAIIPQKVRNISILTHIAPGDQCRHQ